MCIYYPWGHIRYNHITFMHGLIGDDSQHDGGNAKAAEQQSPIPYFENFDLTFEYSPYTAEEEKYLTSGTMYSTSFRRNNYQGQSYLRKEKSSTGGFAIVRMVK